MTRDEVANDNDNVNANCFCMNQDEIWMNKYQEVVDFINANHRNPSRYDAEERGLYCIWLRHNKKLYNSGEMKEARVEMFKELIELSEQYKRKSAGAGVINENDNQNENR